MPAFICSFSIEVGFFFLSFDWSRKYIAYLGCFNLKDRIRISVPVVGVGDLSTSCRAASKAAASSQILFLVGDVLPHKNMFLDTLLVQGLLVYKKDVLEFLKNLYF